MNISKIIAVASLLFISTWVFAFPLCHNQTSLEKQSNLIHNASRMGVENRRPIPKSMQQKFAGTGLLMCGSDGVTAQVTGAANVLTTAAHIFSTENCQAINREGCHFELTVNGRIKTYPVKMETLKTGGPCIDGNFINDWAVLKLKDPIPGITPYEIPEEENILKAGEPIVQITGLSVNYRVNGDYVKSMEICRAETIDLKHPSPIKHSCDTGGTSSGSAQFVKREEKMIFASMNVAQTINAIDGENFDSDFNFNTATPVSGRFLKAIREAMKP